MAEKPHLALVDVTREVAALWRESSASERSVYNELAEQDKLRYSQQLKEWHARQVTLPASGPIQQASLPPPAKSEFFPFLLLMYLCPYSSVCVNIGR